MITSIFKRKKNSGDPFAHKGIVEHNQRNYIVAIDYLEQALKLGLDQYSLAKVYSVLGYCYQETNQLEKAIYCQKTALENDLEYFQAWLGLGLVYRKLNDFDEAKKCYQQGLSIAPENTELLASLGALYIFSGENEQAIELLEKSISYNPSLAIAHSNLAIAYTAVNRFDEAEKAFDNALKHGYPEPQKIQQRMAALRNNTGGRGKFPPSYNYEELIVHVLEKMYPNANERENVINILSQYQSAEPYRVHLGILKCSKGKITEIQRWTQLAISDWRDLLCAAEYPRSSKQGSLKEKNPIKYQELKLQEQDDYKKWLRSVLES